MNVGLSTTMIQRGKSGVAQYVFALVRALLELPDALRLHLFVLEADRPLFAFAGDKVQLIEVPERFRSAVRNIAWHHSALPRLAREWQLDVLHVPSYRRLLWRRPCALVATIHDLAPFHVRGKYDLARMFYGRVVVKRLARRQDEILAVSENTARDLERFFGLTRERVSVVWNGIDHGRFRPGERGAAKAEAARRWNLDRPYFLYVSRLEHPAKNHVRLIRAFEEFKARTRSSWLLVLSGGDWHGADAVHAAARSSVASRDIRLLGFVDDASLPGLYRATDVFVYPSLFEGFGFPPVEAMACGCPVISSTRGALAEVVADAALVVNPENVTDLAGALERMATDAACRTHYRDQGFANARRFDWAANARQTVDLYQRARQGSRR